ncbi:hypothetical protein D9758_015991 [Tetrapyrgos nigripes]|uniref:Uncharacterized protein n=1 Tax=Tetrapyrgos nigripes TaxID=182062 RepID=A0A8H5FBA9_9AGAR|nr:hypothetical protein D9758_015991 [Tetrapyrgos nigripes]
MNQKSESPKHTGGNEEEKDVERTRRRRKKGNYVIDLSLNVNVNASSVPIRRPNNHKQQRGIPDSETTPLTAKCARNSRADGICCKELKADVVRDVLIGLIGLTVPFAVTAGLSSLGASPLVSELIAGAISVGIGEFLASQAEHDHYRYLKNQTASWVIRSCAGTCRAVVKALREGGTPEQRQRFEETGGGLRWSKDVGLTALLLKFGQGLEVPTPCLYISVFTIGLGYLIGGLIPLFPYFFIPQASTALVYSEVIDISTLLYFTLLYSAILSDPRLCAFISPILFRLYLLYLLAFIFFIFSPLSSLSSRLYLLYRLAFILFYPLSPSAKPSSNTHVNRSLEHTHPTLPLASGKVSLGVQCRLYSLVGLAARAVFVIVKALEGGGERTLIDPDVVRDVHIPPGRPGGVAILITGAISMAARVIRSCAGEMLGPVGVDEGTCRAAAKALRGWEVPTSRLYISAFTIGLGYLIGGLVPLFPYFFIPQASTTLIYSCVVMGVVLLVFGAIKTQVSNRYFYSTPLSGPHLGAFVTGAYTSNSTLGVWKGIVWGAVSTLLVGGLAAGAALGIVKALEGGLGVSNCATLETDRDGIGLGITVALYYTTTVEVAF